MNRQKKIKMTLATVVCGISFATVVPVPVSFASSAPVSVSSQTTIETVIAKAVDQMEKAYNTYYKPTVEKSKLPSSESIRKEVKLAERFYKQAREEISHRGGAKKTLYYEKLENKKYLLTRAQGYVTALNVNLDVDTSELHLESAVKSGNPSTVLKKYNLLNQKIIKLEQAISTVYGPEARVLLTKKYTEPAKSKVATIENEMQVYDLYSTIDKNRLLEKDIVKAGELITKAAPFIDKVNKSSKLGKNILSLVNNINLKYEKLKPKNFNLTVMHTNDTHAHLENIARRAGAIEQIREKSAASLLLDAGDVFSGTLYFNEYVGQADLEFMNLIGYDAMTFGNHEFDLGTAPLAAFVKNAAFPLVSANVNFSNDINLKAFYHNQLSKKPKDGNIYRSIIKEVNGEKIGIFGLTTAETTSISSPGADALFEDYIQEANKAVAELERKGVNKIIALTHLGYNDGGGDNDLTLAANVDGIDIIVGGHSHDKLDAPVLVNTGANQEPTVIVQANEYSKYLGTLDVTFNSKGIIVEQAGKLIEIDQKAADGAYIIKENAEIANILATKYAPKVIEKQQTIIGQTDIQLDGGSPLARTRETNLGNLITDSMLEKAQTINPDTVIALQNGGGIRTSIKPGNISLANILEVMPFGNALGILKLTGAEIQAALEVSVKSTPSLSGGFLQVSGLKFTYDTSKEANDLAKGIAGNRVQSVQVLDKSGNYGPLNANQYYFVATNTFTAKGGDGYDMFKKAAEEGRLSEPGFVDWEMLTNYIQAHDNLAPKIEGRIVESVEAGRFNGTTEKIATFVGNVQVDVSNVSELKNAYVKGNLYIKGSSNITFNNVTVDGATYYID